MNSILKFAAVATIGLAALAAPASAASVNGTCGFDFGTTERGDLPNSVPASFSCSKFDSNLGPLTSMVLTVTGQITGPLSLTNNSGQTQVFTFTAGFQYFINPLPGFALLSPAFAPSFTTGLISLSAGNSTNYNLNLNGSTGALVNNSNFAPYQSAGGVGSFPIDFYTLTSTSFSGGGGNIGLGQTTSALSTATVTYNYSTEVQTPEPASMALLGAGLVGVGLLRRRRQK